MNPYSSPEVPSSPQGSQNTGCLRFFVWLMPTMMVLGLAFLISVAANQFRMYTKSEDMIVVLIVISIPGILGIGYFDSKLKRQQYRIPQNQQGHDSMHVIKFFLLQLLIMPAIAFALILGFCAIVS